ncbi:hypothetical protein [Ruminococcus sp.]|uniref:RNA polymerase sigma factor n=1 Tax=Ruminococcus sp. TaxID=41978 RepID=UPI001B069DAB|nr:hypothetical protein [Ruminococcus sp.]MBO5559712.1 sigma-70 family RNA polymerase sigma factor [Ruminococcus sp.]
MRIVNYHEQDSRSVISLPTPLELFKESHSAEEYEELMSFYQSDEWQEVEREELNSDRRYYEGRKVTKLPNDTKAVSDKKKFYESEPFQLRIERMLCKRFEDVFDDPALRRCVKDLTDKQYAVIKLFCKDHTYEEIAELTGNTLNNVSKLKNRALNSIREQYPEAAFRRSDRVPYNIKWYQEYIEGQKKKAKKRKKAA